MSKSKILPALAAALMFGVSVLPQASLACTRTVYVGEDNTVITGRNMDWMEEMQTDLWVFPRGMTRSGNAGPGSPEWTSKYGSVIASGYNTASADGMKLSGTGSTRGIFGSPKIVAGRWPCTSGTMVANMVPSGMGVV